MSLVLSIYWVCLGVPRVEMRDGFGLGVPE